MMQNSSQQKTAQDLEAVITSFNQGEMIREAVQSLCSQTVLPGKIILVDDGSSEEKSLTVLKQIEKDRTLPVRVEILRQANGGVSAAMRPANRRLKGHGLTQCGAAACGGQNRTLRRVLEYFAESTIRNSAWRIAACLFLISLDTFLFYKLVH